MFGKDKWTRAELLKRNALTNLSFKDGGAPEAADLVKPPIARNTGSVVKLPELGRDVAHVFDKAREEGFSARIK